MPGTSRRAVLPIWTPARLVYHCDSTRGVCRYPVRLSYPHFSSAVGKEPEPGGDFRRQSKSPRRDLRVRSTLRPCTTQLTDRFVSARFNSRKTKGQFMNCPCRTPCLQAPTNPSKKWEWVRPFAPCDSSGIPDRPH